MSTRLSVKVIIGLIMIGLIGIPACAAKVVPSTAHQEGLGFHNLSPGKKREFILHLYEEKLWGKPKYKSVYRELIASQVDEKITPDMVVRAIDVVEAHAWKDMDGLIRRIYAHPEDILLYRRAFQYLHKQSGKTPSEDFRHAVFVISEYGNWSPDGYSQSITDEKVKAAQKRLIDEPDEEMVLVYMLFFAAQPNNPPQPSQRAAVEILRTLNLEMVQSRLRSFRIERDPLKRREAALRWVDAQLGTFVVEEN